MISDEWLAQFRDNLEHALDAPTRGDIRVLLREVERLRAENKRMREDLKNFEIALELAGGFVIPADTPGSADGT